MRNLLLFISILCATFLYSQNCSSINATDIFGNSSVSLSCGAGACLELTTNVPTTRLTTSYQVDSQDYAPLIPFNQGTALNANTDDTFSNIIDMPFNFCFYGGTYNKLVISTNGFITFDTKQAGLASNPNILENNPSPLLPQNSIFGVMQDYIFPRSADSEIYYSVVGTAPCRKFIINYYKARLAGCTETSSSQIILSEFTNEIDIIIENKQLPCTTAKFQESLIGIMNAAGDNGLSPAGRNRGIWQSGNESWKFSPAGDLVKPNITWKNLANQTVGNTATINACPTKTDKYTVTLEYLVCDKSFKISDDIDITYDQNGSAPIINSPVSFTHTLCDNNADNTENFDWNTLVTPLVTTDPTMIVRYYNTLAAAEQGGAGINNIRGGKYNVYARVTNTSGCYAIGIVQMDIKFLDKIEAVDIKKLYCFDGYEDFAVDLSTLYPEMLKTPESQIKKVTFYLTSADATLPNEEASVPANQVLTKDGDVVVYTFFVRFENADGCFTVRKITIELRNPVTAPKQQICDFKNDGFENITLSSLNGAVIAGQPVKASYFATDANAQANSGALTTFLLDQSNAPATIYVRLDMVADNGNCYRVYPVELSLILSPILTNNEITVNLGQICDNNNDGKEAFDLTQYENQLYTGTEKFTYSYYTGYNPANGAFSNAISSPKSVQFSQNTVIYVKVSKASCFTSGKINLNFDFLPTVIVSSGTLSKCDKGYDYGETYDLNDAVSSMFSAQNTDALADIEISYHATRDEAEKGIAKISNLQSTFYNTVTFWSRFRSKNSSCYSVAPIVLKTYFPPKAIPSAIVVCDKNLDGNPEVNLLTPEFTENMVSETDPENNFRFYLTLEDVAANKPIQNPENFSARPFPKRIYVLVENLAGCFTLPASIDFTFGTGLAPYQDTFKIEQCDEGGDGKEVLNISQFENQIYTSTAKYSYYPTLLDLNMSTNEIINPSAYLYDKNVNPPVVFVKVSDSGLCPALVKIDIVLKNPPKFELEDFYFCPGFGITIEPNLSHLNPQSYIWKNAAGVVISTEKYVNDIKIAGTYSLTVQNNEGCTYTDYFEVKALETPVITKLVGLSANSYRVEASGSRKILYSINGVYWQTSNIFENIPPGPVTFYVRFEDSDCVGDKKEGLSVFVMNVITPNDDGKNDTWIFENLSSYKDHPSTIRIYDKNGMMIFEETSNNRFLWNGKFNGRSLPSDSYHYIMMLPDKTLSGWILLKNRN